MLQNFCKDANGAFILFDATLANPFHKVLEWKNEFIKLKMFVLKKNFYYLLVSYMIQT